MVCKQEQSTNFSIVLPSQRWEWIRMVLDYIYDLATYPEMIDTHIAVVEELYYAGMIDMDRETLDYYTKAIDKHYLTFIDNLEEDYKKMSITKGD